MGKILNWDKTKEGSSFVYPDIIVYKRNTDENLIEIEVKMAWKNHKKDYDYKKINEYMNQLGFTYGLYIELHEDLENVKVEYGPFNI